MRPKAPLAATLLLLAAVPSAPAARSQTPTPATPTATAPPAAPAAPATPAPAAAPTKRTFAKGKLIPKVDCTVEKGQSYALYIPRSYQPGHPTPILYILDARGRAELPARLFLAGAEKYGYLVASSYQSASDGPVVTTLNAMQAMWNDTHRLFAVDDKRLYVAGFSGTVRAACFMGLSVPGSIIGVIGAGAGFPFERQPTASTPFLFYGTVGDRDFNWDEMQTLESRLTGLHLPHRIEGFSGGHGWMPEERATAALAWLDLRAMKAGTRPKNAAEIAEVEALWQQDLDRARGFEAAGQPIAAFRLYSAMADDYAGLKDSAEAGKKAAEIGASPGYQAAVKERDVRRKEDQRALAEAGTTLAALTPGSGPWRLGKVAGDLHLAELAARAAHAANDKGESDDAIAARRLQNALFVQTSYYLPESAVQNQQFALAAFLVEIAREIRPNEPDVWYALASVHARGGEKKQAFEELRKATELGWSDAEGMASDPDLASLHGEPGWGEILEGVRKRQAAKEAETGKTP
jgi:tetratricopeptide (TPR) repeat protein